ncbi:hypothetical protein GPOL_174p00270 (plasmid) [Gordonia polyisoprenivorans VH2]|uniref:Uncharacterized protein n=1 Tax=Gordonia polyisoprenivorans (strain DSM 44266 / VH2) TaxID=1112204 RepID=H6N503_GORPV|nr:DUF2716 domain-containing protein [Gordonia polyisoprenivorans]AFA76048.1 hypothetical protein GPOL_174p00270 [Gordonia polyisoprenivorans VH2]
MLWKPLDVDENRNHWSAFTQRFTFKPSLNSDDWPSIQPVVPSRTFDLRGDHASYDEFLRAARRVEDAVLDCIGKSLNGAGTTTIYALEWQGTGYKATVDQQADKALPAPPLRVFPDGDYPLLFWRRGEVGVFGDPWEKSLCVFGAPLIEIASQRLTWLPPTPHHLNSRGAHRSCRRGTVRRSPAPSSTIRPLTGPLPYVTNGDSIYL